MVHTAHYANDDATNLMRNVGHTTALHGMYALVCNCNVYRGIILNSFLFFWLFSAKAESYEHGIDQSRRGSLSTVLSLLRSVKYLSLQSMRRSHHMPPLSGSKNCISRSSSANSLHATQKKEKTYN